MYVWQLYMLLHVIHVIHVITCPVGIGLGCISKWLGWIPTVTPLRASTPKGWQWLFGGFWGFLWYIIDY